VKSSASRPLSQLSITQNMDYSTCELPIRGPPIQECWRPESEFEREFVANHGAANTSPSVPIVPAGDWVGTLGSGTDTYQTDAWAPYMSPSSNPTSSSHIPGQPSATLPWEPEDNDPLRELDDSTLQGTHKQRFQKTVNVAHELTAVASGSMMPAYGLFPAADACDNLPLTIRSTLTYGLLVSTKSPILLSLHRNPQLAGRESPRSVYKPTKKRLPPTMIT
jgi:hypothetical protein